MKKKIRVRRVSAWTLGLTLFFAALFSFICIEGQKEFHVLRDATTQYILCEKAAKQLQDGSDYLTEQVRLYAMTGEQSYRDLYFQEAKETRRRELALDTLRIYFDGTDTLQEMQTALDYSQELMTREYYSMRLVAAAVHDPEDQLPDELKETALSSEDLALSDKEKMQKAQDLVCDNIYQNTRTEISNHTSSCMDDLISQTKNQQGRATSIFSDMYRKLEIGIILLIVLLLIDTVIMRRLIVNPLVSYNESIKRGEIFPVVGAEELQNLAVTYNQVYQENQETQKIIRHQAEHDALTELLNRGSFDHILQIYEQGVSKFALILVDVDVFKSVNDTYGHASGDAILKKVASLLMKTFRSVDFICRIGGDEFAVVMVEMSSDLQYTVREKIDYINHELLNPSDGLPAISISVGVAFSDRENPGESIFKDADQALYHTKQHGKHGCSFYGSLL